MCYLNIYLSLTSMQIHNFYHSTFIIREKITSIQFLKRGKLFKLKKLNCMNY